MCTLTTAVTPGQFGVRIEDTELNADTFDTLEQLTALIQSRQK